MAAKTTVTPQLTHTQDYVLERITIDKPTTLSPRDGFVWTLNYNISTIRALVKKGVLEWGQHDRPRYGQTENETKVRLTDLGREYAILQGWLPAPTEAQQAAPVASADSVNAVDGYMRPCDACDGSGTEYQPDMGYYLPCDECDGTGIFTPAVEIVTPTPAAQPTSAQAGGDAVSDAPRGRVIFEAADIDDKDATIAALEAELATARAEIKRLKKTSRMDDGYIDFLEAKRED